MPQTQTSKGQINRRSHMNKSAKGGRVKGRRLSADSDKIPVR